MNALLGNIFWHALSGAQAQYATGTAEARRFAPGFPPLVGFADPARPHFDALLPFCEPGELLYCAGWSGAVPAGWRVEHETTVLQLVWQGDVPATDAAPEAVRLGPGHAAQAFELAKLTRPGPFGPRTIELGEYFGCFDGGRLVAMAGERMHAGTLREISGVCTHPDFQGRGFARRLMTTLIAREMQRGETPFLHVMQGNTGARELYERMGFRQRRAFVLRVLVAPATRPQRATGFRLVGLDHLVLRVRTLDTMLAFYCGVLGCSVERRQDTIGLVQLRAGNALIDLVPVDGPLGRAGGAAPGREARNLDHFCLRIEPFDETSIRQQLSAHGIDAGPVESRFGAEGEGPSIYLDDPEGNVVELKGPPARKTP